MTDDYIDHVSRETAAWVRARDRGCVANRLGAGSLCADAWGTPMSAYDLDKCELAHVKDDPRMGKRATSDEWHLVVACPGHHRGTGTTRAWIDQHAPIVREYLRLARAGTTVARAVDDDNIEYDSLPFLTP